MLAFTIQFSNNNPHHKHTNHNSQHTHSTGNQANKHPPAPHNTTTRTNTCCLRPQQCVPSPPTSPITNHPFQPTLTKASPAY